MNQLLVLYVQIKALISRVSNKSNEKTGVRKTFDL